MAVIRVLQVFTIMNRGGAESMIMNYYRKLNKEKVQFDFLVHRLNRAAFDDEIEALGGHIYRLPSINPLFPKSYYNKLRTFFKTHNNYPIIHSHLNTFSYFPLKIAKEFNIPCRIAHAHIAINKVSFISIINNKEGFRENLKKIIKLELKKRIKTHSTHFFSCGNKAGNWLFGDTPFTTMNNAIDAEKFKYDISVEKAYRKKYNLQDELVIGHIGRFVSQKNHSFLLKIFSEILKLNSRVSLVLIGDGPLKKELEKEAKDLSIIHKIKFLGIRTDIPELCQMMDIFIFPSFYEGLPVTLIEAQAAGIKVFASSNITREVRLTNDIQFISHRAKPELWAKNTLNISSFSKNNNYQQIVNKNYDITNCCSQLEQFYLNQSKCLI